MSNSKKTENRIVVLVAGMLIQLCAGIIYMWSVFRGPVAAHLNWNLGDAGITSSIMLVAFVVGIVGGGRVQDKIDTRKVAFCGSVLISLGMIATSFVTKNIPWLIYVTYGVIAGLGVGIVYTTTLTVIQKWFADKRGFATGMMVASFGFSLVIFTPITKELLGKTGEGMPFTFRLFGILFLVICGICSFFIKNPSAPVVVAGSEKNAPAVTERKQYTTMEMLKTKQFYFIALSMLFILPAYFILNPLFTSLGVERGLSEGLATIVVMMTGVANASGRLVISWVSDLVGRKNAIYGIIALTLIGSLGIAFAQGILFFICCLIIAFAFGGSSSVYPPLTADSFGTKNAGLNYGCVMVGFGFSALVFPIISKNLVSGSGSYVSSFVVAAAMTIVALCFALFIKKPQDFLKAEQAKEEK